MRTQYLIATIATIVALGLPASAIADPRHQVADGESLTSIATVDGLSVAQLAAANGLSPNAELITGTTLKIPAQSAAVSAAGTSGGYRVVFGDTLSAIAARDGVTVSELAAANSLNPAGLLPAGTTLTIPGATTAKAGVTESPAPAASSDAGAAQPTGEVVSPSQVGEAAISHGVSPSLAQAIADQESGFNNNEVSSTGAVGVMQIEPGTWDYIRTVLGKSQLRPDSAHDNVLGGVALLHSLLDQTGGDPQLAAAGYYQGLASVRAHGMYPETRRYVRNVMALRARFGGG
jgi:LysM repeat protein